MENLNKEYMERFHKTESVVVRMLGASALKINSLDIFKKAGIIGKTIVYSNKGGRTEDMKLFTIDFEDWLNKGLDIVKLLTK